MKDSFFVYTQHAYARKTFSKSTKIIQKKPTYRGSLLNFNMLKGTMNQRYNIMCAKHSRLQKTEFS